MSNSSFFRSFWSQLWQCCLTCSILRYDSTSREYGFVARWNLSLRDWQISCDLALIFYSWYAYVIERWPVCLGRINSFIIFFIVWRIAPWLQKCMPTCRYVSHIHTYYLIFTMNWWDKYFYVCMYVCICLIPFWERPSYVGHLIVRVAAVAYFCTFPSYHCLVNSRHSTRLAAVFVSSTSLCRCELISRIRELNVIQ